MRSEAKTIVFFLVWSGLIGSCTPGHYHAETHEINEGEWPYEQVLSFPFTVTDTVSRYDIELQILHADNYAYQNIYIKITTTFPDSQKVSQTLPIDFADKQGRWYGDCRMAKCRLSVALQENAYFNQMGEYSIAIEQYMRVDPVEGLHEVSLVIDQHK